MGKLRQQQRNWAQAKLIEDGTTTYPMIGVKLKGAAGSFRPVDDRPALTISMSKYTKTQRFHDMEKFHLNNSVQDGTYLHELVSSELFMAAGVPATRVTHARVWLNGRDLGFYVLKEGFDSAFIRRHFATPGGNLYDGGFLQEIDAPLEKDSGKGPDDRSDLAALSRACRVPDLNERKKALAEILDIDQFLAFMAMEVLTCHWDGYCRNRNNYRVYFDAATKQAQFLPHGMDQMFNDPNASVVDAPGALVSQAVLQIPEYAAAYRAKQRSLIKLFTAASAPLQQIDLAVPRIRAVLTKMDPGAGANYPNVANGFRQQVLNRCRALAGMIQEEPEPISFDAQGVAQLPDWKEKADTQGAKLYKQTLFGEKKVYAVECGAGGNTVASWRVAVALPPGRYSFTATAKGNGILPTDNTTSSGGGIRVSGSPRTNQVVGTTGWLPLTHIFDVDVTKRVELVLELRALRGAVMFDIATVKLRKVK